MDGISEMKITNRHIKKMGIFFFILIMLPIPFSVANPKPNNNLDNVPFVVGTLRGPDSLDPLLAYDSASMDTIMQICEGLYRYNYSSNEMNPIPCLASSMGLWSPNKKELTISLKTGVTFHDGSKFNASSVKWNFDRLQYWTYGFDLNGDESLEVHPSETLFSYLFKIGDTVILNRTEILDEYTIKIYLNLPCVIWEKLLAFIACTIVLPDLDEEGIPYYGDIFLNGILNNETLIGTGPFLLTDYEFDNQVVFDYYPDYHLLWEENHINRMIYLIIPDDVTSSLAVLNHEVHWGGVIADYIDYFNADPDLMSVAVKRTTVYYVQMNLYNMQRDIRYASSFAWNHTHWLGIILSGNNYELHVPIPDGMQYHLEGFEGEPEYDLAKARQILLDSADAGIAANITANNLSATNATAEWRLVGESGSPVAWYNFTRYESTTVLQAAQQLQDNLKNIGIRLEILEPMDWVQWVQDYQENPTGHQKLAYSFGEWSPDYNDPINMIEPLYGTNANSNCFGLNNATWNQKLIDTYSTTGDYRQELFYEIQEDFAKIHIPSFYILQYGTSVNFNIWYLDKDSLSDLFNPFGYLYWFNAKYNDYPTKKIVGIPEFLGATILGVILVVCVGSIIIFIKTVEKRKQKMG